MPPVYRTKNNYLNETKYNFQTVNSKITSADTNSIYSNSFDVLKPYAECG